MPHPLYIVFLCVDCGYEILGKFVKNYQKIYCFFDAVMVSYMIEKMR